MNELTTVFRQPIVGDLIYGGDFYYAQITRVGENVVEFETIGPIADEDAIRGPKGDKGDTGDTGATGPQGPQGIPGEVQFKDIPGVNLAMPDLAGKEHLGDGVYRLNDANNITVDYNVNNGNYIMNGTSTIADSIVLGYFDVPEQSYYTMKFYHVSGDVNASDRPRISFTLRFPYVSGIYNDTMVSNLDISQQTFETQPGTLTYNNLTFKLKIEKGDTITPYIMPDRVPQFALKQQEAWITPTLLNGWENRGDGYATLQYMKDSFGFVHIKGSVRNGIAQTVMALPAGYRPSEHRRYMAVVDISEWVFTNVLSSSALNVNMNNQPGKVVYFNIIYKAEV